MIRNQVWKEPERRAEQSWVSSAFNQQPMCMKQDEQPTTTTWDYGGNHSRLNKESTQKNNVRMTRNSFFICTAGKSVSLFLWFPLYERLKKKNKRKEEENLGRESGFWSASRTARPVKKGGKKRKQEFHFRRNIFKKRGRKKTAGLKRAWKRREQHFVLKKKKMIKAQQICRKKRQASKLYCLGLMKKK